MVILSIGKRLKAARKSRKISQDTLAEMIGVSRGVVTNIELDKVTDPQLLYINAICNTLHINREWLLKGVGDMDINKTIDKSSKILSEIYEYSETLSEEEQKYILDLIKLYKHHRTLKDNN